LIGIFVAMNLRQVKFTDYYPAEYEKRQVYLHHTAGSAEGERQFSFWQGDPVKVATCVCISRDGEIVQGYSSRYWAYHLGMRTSHFKAHGLNYQNLDKHSIGVEICNWGWLTERSGEFYTYVGSKIPKDRVIALDEPYRGHTYWESYTDEQIASVIDLLRLWEDRYGIDISYRDDIWDVNKRALSGDNGVFTHNSVRPDKTDVYPHPGLIDALKKL
jgi:N-acetyl-anhydromuramyl-L-alanine amidase AmpD